VSFLQKNLATQHQNLTRFWTTSRHDREYLWKASRYRQSANGIASLQITHAYAHFIWWTFVRLYGRSTANYYTGKLLLKLMKPAGSGSHSASHF